MASIARKRLRTSVPGLSDMTLYVFLYGLVCLSWGTTWLGIKIAVETTPPLTAAGLRFVVAFPLFLLFARVQKLPVMFPKGNAWFFIFVTVMYFCIPYYLINHGEVFVSSGLSALIFSTMPVFIIIFSVWFLNDRIYISQWFGIAIGFLCLVMIIRSQGLEFSFTELLGVLAILGAAVMHALCYVVTKKHGTDISVITYNTLPIGIAGFGLCIAGFLIESPTLSQISMKSWLALIYLGIVASVGGFIAYFYLLKKINTVVLSFVFIIFPVFAVTFSSWYEGIPFASSTVFYIALMIVGFSVTKAPPEKYFRGRNGN